MPGNFGNDDESIEPRRNRQGAGLYPRTTTRDAVPPLRRAAAPTAPYRWAATTTGPPTDAAVNGTGPTSCSKISFAAKPSARTAPSVSRRSSSASAPAATKPCSTPDNPTYQSTVGLEHVQAEVDRCGRSDARRAPVGVAEHVLRTAAPMTASAARFGHRCPSPKCTRWPDTSRQYSPLSIASRS